MGTAVAYAPYPRTLGLGFIGAPERVEAVGGWHTPTRSDLIAEFTQDQRRAPTAGEIVILRRLAERNNEVLRRMIGGHSPSRNDERDFNTAQGLINFYLVHARGPDGGDPVGPPRGGREIEDLIKAAVNAVPGKKSFLKEAVDVITAPINVVVHAAEKIPVIGDVVKIVDDAATAPLRVVDAIASGARLDHVALGALKDQLKIVKEAAPYAQTVVSLMPGVGSGVAAGIALGAALAEGQSITEAGKSAIRGALPGGALAAAAFDTAMKVAGGANVVQSALESARAAIPSGAAQKAFDVGLAVVTGEKIQTALAKGIASIAPGQLQAVLTAGEKALASTPGLANALKSVAPGSATQGFKLAAGLLSHSGLSEKALIAVRNQIPAEVRQGFDTALKTQEGHLAWLKNVTSAPVTPTIGPVTHAPVIRDVPKKTAAPAPAPKTTAPVIRDVPKKTVAPVIRDVPKKVAGKYAPYPPSATGAATHGLGSLWGSSKWRWFAVYANGAPVAQRGPLWLSDEGAQREAAAFLESTQGRAYVGTVARWDWDADARQWHQAPSSGLGAPPHPHPHGGGGHPHGGHGGGGHPRIFHGGRGVPGWWGEYYPLPAEVVTKTETCRTWGDLVPIPPSMVQAVKTAIGSSGGRPTTMRSPDDGTLYLFTVEDGGIAARPCASVGVGDWGQWKQAANDAWSEWRSEVSDLWRGV